MHAKTLTYSAIALTFGLGLAYPAYAQDAGGAVGGATGAVEGVTKDVTGAVGGATKDVTGAVGGAAGAATDTVTGATGDVTANKGGQNDVGKGQIAGDQKGGQGSGQATFGNLIAALNNVSAQVQNVRALENVNVVDVVDADNLLAGNNVQALNNALNRNDVDINVLREAINNNNVLNNALQNANVAVTDVVAVEVLSGGDIVVFTR